jgi:hypothetical protein
VIAGTQLVNLAEANWMHPVNPSPPSKPEISIFLPESNKKYSSNIGIDFLVTGPNWGYYEQSILEDSGSTIKLSSFNYSLDDKPNVTLDGEQIVLSNSTSLDFRLRFLGNLSGLSDGLHSIVVYAQAEGQYSPEYYMWENFTVGGSSPKTFFTVDTEIKDTVLPEISILSPTNRVYNKSDVALDFTLSETCSQIKYSLDGQNNVMIDGNTTLTGLPEGAHNIAIYASDLAGNTKSSIVCFTVGYPPTILITSLKSTYYGVNNVTLNFTVNEAASWIGYSLDSQNNKTMSNYLLRTITLTNLTYGSHTIVLYATDKNGNIGASEIAKFSISEEPEPFPTTLVTVASGASVAVVGVGLLVYFKKRKH